MMVKDPVETYADNDKAWERFQEYFIQVKIPMFARAIL